MAESRAALEASKTGNNEEDNIIVLLTDDEQDGPDDSSSLILDSSLKSSLSQTSQDEEDSEDISINDNNNKKEYDYEEECLSPNRETNHTDQEKGISKYKLDFENVDDYLKDHSLDQPSTSGFSKVLIEQIDKELSSSEVGAESKLEEFLSKPGTSGIISNITEEDNFTKPSISNEHDDKFDEDTGLYKREVENTDLAPVINKEIGEKASSLLTYPCKPVTLSGAFYEGEQKVNITKTLYEIHSRNDDHISPHETSGLFEPEPEDRLEDEESHCQCIGDESEYDSTDEHPEEDERANEGSQSDEYASTPRKRKNESPSSTVAKRPYRPSTTANDIPIVEPEMESPVGVNTWLNIFTSWNGSDRLKAIEQLIKKCSADQVRHMMVTIEPLFQRDFISHLPEEVALQILRYLSPEDLLKAAQTSKFWKDLSDDNLLWKEQCQRVGITAVSRKIKLMPVEFASSWKAEYMRNKYIEHKWLTKPMSSAKILKAHDDHVITCLQFYGNIILSGSDDTTLKLWSAVTGKCLRTLIGHTGGVWSSQMYKKTVISGSTDRTLRVWDAETGICLKILTGHTSTVRCMHLHEDRVVSGSRDATLRVWSVSEGQCLKVLVGHLAAVRCVQYDGKLVVSGAYDYYVKVWNPETGECLHTLEGHTNRVYSLQFDGHHIVSGSLDTSIIVWDAASGAIKHSLTGHQSLTSGMELRDNILVSGNADSTVKVWDIITGQCLHTLAGPNKHQSAVTCLQLNNRFVITSSDDGTVKLWDVKTGEFIRNLVTLDSGGSGGVVWRIRASQTKLVCAVGSRNGTEETKLMVMNFDVPSTCLTCHTLNAFL